MCLPSAPRVAYPAPFTLRSDLHRVSGGVPQKGPRMQFNVQPRTWSFFFFFFLLGIYSRLFSAAEAVWLLYFFFAGQNNNIKWRRRRKILRVRCKNLAFYTTEPLKRTLFCGAKNEKWRRRQKKIKEQPFPKGTPVVQPRFYQAGKKCGKKIESALIWGRHLQKGLVKSVGFFFPLQISLFFFFFFFFFFFENQFFNRQA